jgi:hypothetical protein
MPETVPTNAEMQAIQDRLVGGDEADAEMVEIIRGLEALLHVTMLNPDLSPVAEQDNAKLTLGVLASKHPFDRHPDWSRIRLYYLDGLEKTHNPLTPRGIQLNRQKMRELLTRRVPIA